MSGPAEMALEPRYETYPVAHRRATVTVTGMLRAIADRWLTPRRATLLALLLFGMAAWGDFVTTAEATFTLFYVVPLALAVWYAGLRVGYVIAGLSVVSGVLIDVFQGPRPSSWYFLGWNNFVDGALYVIFARVLAALRARIALESRLRMDTLDQLRHAERLTTIGKLASGIAHEIGSPLNVISGHAELLMSGRVGADAVRGTGKILLEQSERVTTIVQQLLDFAKRGGTRVINTNIAELAVSTTHLLESLARKSGIEIVHDHKGSVWAEVNRSQMQQVLTNLTTNAIHAMPNGGRISIQVHAENSYVPKEAPDGPPRDYVVLTVHDTGTGIPSDVLPKIFDPFFTTKDVGQGTGLGLSVAYGIVRDHGGWIAVNTRLGAGTTFSVYVPRVAKTSSITTQ